MKRQLSRFLYNYKDSTKKLRAATIAMQCDIDPGINRIKMIRMVENILKEDPLVELIFFGEVILSWYNPGKRPELHQQTAETIPGDTTQVFCTLAVKHEIYLCFGMSEKSDQDIYNTQVLINPRGEIQATHRKRRLKESTYQSGKQMFTLTEIKGIKTALLICADAADPETMWSMSKSRPELILLSLADDKDEDRFMAQLNARLYDAWMISSNRFGWEAGSYWNGHIGFSNPLGELCLIGQDKAQYLSYDLSFVDYDPLLKRTLRKILVKLPLGFLILRHWKQIRTYY